MATAAGEHCVAVARPASGRAGRARGDVHAARAGRERHAVPADDDVRGVPALRGHASDDARGARGCRSSLARDYDPRPLPVREKRAALIGMGMTERQGGSDVRSQPHARRARPATARYRLTGHKWFFSAPQCDAHLVLAQDSAGVGCFLRAALSRRRHAQRDAHQAPEGQARQPLERVVRGRVRRRPRLRRSASRGAASRRSSRWCGTRASIACSARAGMMRGALAWALHHASPPHRVRTPARRAAADAQRARRSGARGRGRDGAGAAPRARVRRRRREPPSARSRGR